MDRWIQYLYEQHSEKELKEWASRLKFFRYFRAYGGHANDGDSLDIALKYESTDRLIDILKSLGIDPMIYSKKPDQPIPGTRYNHEEYTSFPSLIPNTEWIKQPSHCEIFGIKVHIWCENGLINISANPGSYTVTVEHVESAEKLESKFGNLKQFILDPPKDTKHYVCPKYHPSIFS
ncbi:hypothetical protein [Saccharophagus degradans]|uniref:Uncharacterized protein n=1 Tax=Saccharophagus degradans TaxID=86304 RepID=A0AAW7X1D1_9GAMM|nr:hypothetical protein [Saccharophagus degradans]MDO6421545.1 hypothetical protein [Saccharophagus degradans]MDO6608507.1 hypothetical protein [Saccharophagus degradans]